MVWCNLYFVFQYMFIFFATNLTFKHWEEQRSKNICILLLLKTLLAQNSNNSVNYYWTTNSLIFMLIPTEKKWLKLNNLKLVRLVSTTKKPYSCDTSTKPGSNLGVKAVKINSLEGRKRNCEWQNGWGWWRRDEDRTERRAKRSGELPPWLCR